MTLWIAISPYFIVLFAWLPIQIRNSETQTCLDTMGRKGGENVGISYCHGLGGNQVFAYTKRQQIMSDDNCLDATGTDGMVKLIRCHGMAGNQAWLYDSEVLYLTHFPPYQLVLVWHSLSWFWLNSLSFVWTVLIPVLYSWSVENSSSEGWLRVVIFTCFPVGIFRNLGISRFKEHSPGTIWRICLGSLKVSISSGSFKNHFRIHCHSDIWFCVNLLMMNR